MAMYRVMMQFPYDSALPRDLITVNPHYSGTDPNALLGALKTNLNTWAPTAGKPFTLKAYDAAKPPPSYPVATISSAGTTPATGIPREVALCLSYYSSANRPRYRGRLYLPAAWLGGGLAMTPTTTQMNLALDFGKSVLSKSLPSGHQWSVYSRIDKNVNDPVQNIWVDNEWDTQRSRGLRATTRVTATIP